MKKNSVALKNVAFRGQGLWSQCGINQVSWYQHSATLKLEMLSNVLTRKGCSKTVCSRKLSSYSHRMVYLSLFFQWFYKV